MAKIVTKPVIPVYLVGLTWVVWSVFFPLYALPHFAGAIVASILVYLVALLLFPDRLQESAPADLAGASTATSAPQESTPKPETTGNPELDALLKERDRAISEMRRLNNSIEDAKISGQIDHMEEVTRKIISHVLQTPSKLSQIRKFLNYYLPTTLKLLNAYDRMDSAGVSGANIDGAMGKIEGMMDTIVTAFDRQLDGLFGDEALDISTDITVMEQMLAREGIGGMQL